jgi:hypothetical protein
MTFPHPRPAAPASSRAVPQWTTRSLDKVLGHPRTTRAARVLARRVLIPLARHRARTRVDRLASGQVTIVTVNWNSWDYLTVLLDVVRRRSPVGTRILVVDNGSTDGSRRHLRHRDDVETLFLPVNLGHEIALDLGVLSCRTEFFIVLDVDAFPLHNRWTSELLTPLDHGAEVSGARLWRPYVHPCCLAMRTARFVTRGHSFRSDYRPRTESAVASGDVGEELSAREAPRLHFFDISSQRGPGDIGTVFGDLVYHNFYGTRFGGGKAVLDKHITPGDPRAAWAEALERYVR